MGKQMLWSGPTALDPDVEWCRKEARPHRSPLPRGEGKLFPRREKEFLSWFMVERRAQDYDWDLNCKSYNF